MLMTFTTESARIRPGFDVTLLPQRNYDTNIGRFTSLDTFEGDVADPLTLNRYAYAQSDPVNIVDPSGHEGLVGLTVSIGIGGLINGSISSFTGGSFWKGFATGAAGAAVGYLTFGFAGPLFGAGTRTFGYYAAAWLSGSAGGAAANALSSIWDGEDDPQEVAFDALEGAVLGGAFGLGFGAAFRGLSGAWMYLSRRNYGKGLLDVLGDGPVGETADVIQIQDEAQAAFTKLPKTVRDMMHGIFDIPPSRPLSDFTKLPIEQQKVIIDYYAASAARGGGDAMATFRLNVARIQYLIGQRSTPPGSVANFKD